MSLASLPSDAPVASHAPAAPPQPDAQVLIERARALIPSLRAAAAEADRNRRLADSSFEEIQAAELLGILKPKRFGGLQLGLFEHASVAMELARGDGSAGWIFSLLDEHNWFLSRFSTDAQDEVWGADPKACAAGSLRPIPGNGRAQAVAGGYRVSGRFSFISGSDHAKWIFVGTFLEGPDGGHAEPYIFLLPKDRMSMVDDWFVLGLRGTGSRTYVADEVFVPQHRAAHLAEFFVSADMPGVAEYPDWKLLKAPRFNSTPFVAAAPAVGMALGAVDVFADIVRKGGARDKAALPSIQMKFAESAAEADAARKIIEADTKQQMALIDAGDSLSQTVSVQMRRDGAFVGLLAQRCVDRLHASLGSSAIFEAHPMSLSLRNVHAAIAQLEMHWDTHAPPYAVDAFGL